MRIICNMIRSAIHRFLFVAAAAIGFGSFAIAPAAASDLSVGGPVPAPIFDWGGVYVGAHFGAAWDQTNWTEDASTSGSGGLVGPGFSDGKVSSSGVLGGGQAGFNYQTNWVVFGMQADVSGAGISGSTSCFPELAPATSSCSTNINAFGTVTMRFGAVYGNSLFYVLGGLAWANERLANPCNMCSPTFGPSTAVYSSIRDGFTAGLGIEYAFAGGWSAFLQYNYATLNKRDLSFNSPAPANFTENIGDNMNVIKAGINYTFHWGPQF